MRIPRIQSESFVSRHLKLALPFSRTRLKLRFMVRGFFQVVWITAGFCGLSIDRGVFRLLISGPIFCHFPRDDRSFDESGCLVLSVGGRPWGIPVLYHEMHCPTADWYTVLITLISYTGFRLTQPVSIEQQPRGKCGIDIGSGPAEARRASRGWAHRSLKSTLRASHRSFNDVSMTWRNSPPHLLLHHPPSLACPSSTTLFSGRMIRSS